MTEQVIYEGRPSQLYAFSSYCACIMGCWLIFPVFFAIWQWLKIQNTKYRITTESVLVESGIFIRDINELKLSRIVDIRYHDTTMGRLFGVSMIVLYSTDVSNKRVYLYGLKDGKKIWESLRENIKIARKDVYEVEQHSI